MSLEILPVQANPTRVGLNLPSDLSYEEWLEVGKRLELIDQASRWWWGDWLNYQDGAYGAIYTAAIEHSDLSYQSLADAKWVAGAIGFSRRRENLSWSHHQEVAGLEPDEQDRWLNRAEAEHLTRERLRAMIRGARPLPAPVEPRPEPLWRAMVGATSAQVITLLLRVCFHDAQEVLDPTYGSGNFWDGTAQVNVTGHDIDPSRSAAGPMDFTDLKYGDLSFDVVVFDPPHLDGLGKGSVMGDRYGTATNTEKLRKDMMAGARECWRVCHQGLIVKVTDHSHSGLFLMESDWVGEALEWQTPFEMVHQISLSGTPTGWNWGEQYSAYNNCSTYLVFKKGSQKHDGK